METKTPTDFRQAAGKLPQLGVGVGLHRRHFDDIRQNVEQIGWLEIITENYLGKGGLRRRILRDALDLGLPVVPHGVALSIGGTDPFSEQYLSELESLLDEIDPPWFSDHLCFTASGGFQMYELMPLPYTWEAVHHVVERIGFIQRRFDRPFLIENASCYAYVSKPEMSEGQFLAEIAERADCGLLLDVNNIYVNANNFHTDAMAFLNDIPLERVVQLHIAGHRRGHDFIVDTHGENVSAEVYQLLEEVLKRTNPRAILLERDSNIPPLDELLDEMRTIREIAARVGKPMERL